MLGFTDDNRLITGLLPHNLPLLLPYKRVFAAWQQEHGSPPELTVKLSTNGTDRSNQARTRTEKQRAPGRALHVPE